MPQLAVKSLAAIAGITTPNDWFCLRTRKRRSFIDRTTVRQTSADVRVGVRGRVVDVQIPQASIRTLIPVTAHDRDILVLTDRYPMFSIARFLLFL